MKEDTVGAMRFQRRSAALRAEPLFGPIEKHDCAGWHGFITNGKVS